MAELVSLYPSNYRDPVATLRYLADQIEKGDHGDVRQVVVVLRRHADSEPLCIFGMGPDSSIAADAMLLAAGHAWIVREAMER